MSFSRFDLRAKKLQRMSDSELGVIWAALGNYEPHDMYDPDMTMDDWTKMVQSEVNHRGFREIIRSLTVHKEI